MPSLFLFVFFNSLLDLSGLLCYTHAVRCIPPMGKGDILWTTRKSPAAVAEELVFSNSMPTSWKNGALPRMSSRKKIADYFGITVEELMGTKKEPAGMGELDKQMQEIVELLNSATSEQRNAVETLLRSRAKPE
mgnify:CR=1 FL=1